MTIREWSVSDILKNVRNSADYGPLNTHAQWHQYMYSALGERQTPAIIHEIQEKGFTDPILLYHDNPEFWTLGNGHHRLAIAILLGLDKIPVSENGTWSSSTGHEREIYHHPLMDYDEAQWIANTMWGKNEESRV